MSGSDVPGEGEMKILANLCVQQLVSAFVCCRCRCRCRVVVITARPGGTPEHALFILHPATLFASTLHSFFVVVRELVLSVLHVLLVLVLFCWSSSHAGIQALCPGRGGLYNHSVLGPSWYNTPPTSCSATATRCSRARAHTHSSSRLKLIVKLLSSSARA